MCSHAAASTSQDRLLLRGASEPSTKAHTQQWQAAAFTHLPDPYQTHLTSSHTTTLNAGWGLWTFRRTTLAQGNPSLQQSAPVADWQRRQKGQADTPHVQRRAPHGAVDVMRWPLPVHSAPSHAQPLPSAFGRCTVPVPFLKCACASCEMREGIMYDGATRVQGVLFD